MYALLRHFVEIYLVGAVAVEQFQRQIASFQAACATLDLISVVKQGRLDVREGAEELRRAHAEHLRLHIEAYGTEHILPKHHMMFDVADQWGREGERHGAVIDAFVVERLHIRIKYVMDPICNTSDFEVSCLASLVNAHLMALKDHEFGDGLLGKTSVIPGMGVPIADRMSISGLTIEVGDVVLLDGAAGRVCACAKGAWWSRGIGGDVRARSQVVSALRPMEGWRPPRGVARGRRALGICVVHVRR